MDAVAAATENTISKEPWRALCALVSSVLVLAIGAIRLICARNMAEYNKHLLSVVDIALVAFMFWSITNQTLLALLVFVSYVASYAVYKITKRVFPVYFIMLILIPTAGLGIRIIADPVSWRR